jgi:hypothetical protein
MSNGTFVMALTVGAALLALWTHVRFPSLAPERLTRTIAHVVAAFALLLTLPGLGHSPTTVLAGVFLLVLPALAYALLCTIWMLKHFQAALGLSR